MYCTNKRKIMISFALCATVILALHFAYLSVPARASMNVSTASDGSVRIIIGDIGTGKTRAYSSERNKFLNSLAESNPSDHFTAVVPLNDYYPISDINELVADRGLTIERVFMWTPGETGKLVLNIENNDIYNAIDNYLSKLESRKISSAMEEDLQKLQNGEFKIYALSITDSAERLLQLSEQETSFAGVDVLYNPEAEEYALSKNQTFSYVELPSKPDGQL